MRSALDGAKPLTKTMKTKTERLIRLRTHAARSRFVRKEMRAQRLSDVDLADLSGKNIQTIQRFTGVVPTCLRGMETRDPWTSTTISIFEALGYNVVFERVRKPRGTVGF